MKELPANIISNRMAYLDSNAKPLAYGRLMIYKDNSSTSLALVYSDMELTPDKLLENPVLLDSDGRTNSGLYVEGSVYVKVEKYIGKDELGEDIYSMVYDFETPPGVDISRYFNSNYVETYRQLRDIANKHPTWVTGEGNPHLYVWNPNQESQGLNEITDISSYIDPSGSWHWETKEIYADQAGIKKAGQPYNTDIWGVLAKIIGVKIIIPHGRYYLKSQMEPIRFDCLEIMSGVFFENLSDFWKISISSKVECFSVISYIKWVSLPRGFYDASYFLNVARNSFRDGVTYIEDELQVNKDITAQGDIATPKKITSKDLIVKDKATINSAAIGASTTSTSLEITGKTKAQTIEANLINSKGIRLSDSNGDEIIETKGKLAAFSLVNLEPTPNFVNPVPLERLNDNFPIGSYITGFSTDNIHMNQMAYLDFDPYTGSSQIQLINDEFFKVQKSQSSHTIATFVSCGLIVQKSMGSSLSGYIYLLRRIE